MVSRKIHLVRRLLFCRPFRDIRLKFNRTSPRRGGPYHFYFTKLVTPTITINRAIIMPSIIYSTEIQTSSEEIEVDFIVKFDALWDNDRITLNRVEYTLVTI